MAFESIHNYYEKLVLEHITAKLIKERGIDDSSFLEDVACIALNQLPSHYVRYDVDKSFYMTDKERGEMEQAVEDAVKHAAEYVSSHARASN